ncbi:hypothetical protein [Streptomyces sp. DT9]
MNPAAQTLGGFVGAHLAGSGQLNRYLTPGTELTAVSLAPYARIEVAQVAAGHPPRRARTTPHHT